MKRSRMLLFAIMLSVIALAVSSRSAHPSAAAPLAIITLDVNMGGGYALVFSKDQQSLSVGSIAPPTTAEQKDHHYERHPMRLTVEKGEFDLGRSNIPPVNIGEAGNIKLGWDLTGYRVQIVGTDTALKTLALPPANPKSAAVACTRTTTLASAPDEKNLSFTPLLASLAPDGRTLRQDWATELDARLELTGGRFEVTTVASGCVEYVEHSADPKSTPKHRQRIASGRVENTVNGGLPGLRYRTTRAAKFVDLEFLDYTTGDSKGRVSFRPNATGKIELNLDPRLPKTTSTAELIKPQLHFEMFYRLLTPAVPKAERLLARWTGPTGISPVTPGEGCGSARFIATQ